jgi:hypothetical protein
MDSGIWYSILWGYGELERWSAGAAPRILDTNTLDKIYYYSKILKKYYYFDTPLVEPTTYCTVVYTVRTTSKYEVYY